MKLKSRALRRIGYAFSALVLSFAIIWPALEPGMAHADQVADRSITLSDSGVSGGAITTGVGSGTAVTYRVSFSTSAAASSLVIDFCENDPIIDDSCITTVAGGGYALGMDASAAALATVTGGGNIQTSGWNVTAGTTQVKLAVGSGTATAAGQQTFDLTGIQNPSHLGTFYARVYTYTGSTWGTYADASGSPGPGNFVDYGGFALSTVQIITITARVQETLMFCVSGNDPTTTWTTKHDCSDTAITAPALILGHGTPTAILDSSQIDTGTVFSQLSTNATNGAVIAMRNNNTSCGGLSADGGLTCAIPAINSGAATASVMNFGTAAFGMFCATGTDDPGGSGVNPGTGADACTAPYHNASHLNPADINTFPSPSDAMWFGMDTQTAQGTDTTTDALTGNSIRKAFGNDKTTFGSEVATTTGPVYHIDNAYTFAATSALTTPAGIYTANLDMVATGTF